MRILLRLATFCLSLALLSGMLVHELAAAKMSVKMAAGVSSFDTAHDPMCPTCSPDDQHEAVCDMDCTAPVFSTAGAPQLEPVAFQTSPLKIAGTLDLTGLDPGSDPFPPRSTFLS